MISDLAIHSDMVDRESVLRDWAIVRQNYPVPTNLHDHQIDAMGLLKEGRNVFLGKYTAQIHCSYIIKYYLQRSQLDQGRHSHSSRQS